MKLFIIKSLIFIIHLNSLIAQSQPKTFEYKKGEVLDIILFSSIPNSKPLFEKYKKTAFPVAKEYSYQPLSAFKVPNLTLGNILPQRVILSKWKSLEKRERFLNIIEDRVPDFHDQRRNLYTYLGLTYFKLEKDIQFSISPEKYNLVTSFWQNDRKHMKSFIKNWKHKIEKYRGSIIVELNSGKSPVGYNYQPDVLCIISWKNKSSFEEFTKNNPLSTYNNLKHVHQFVIN